MDNLCYFLLFILVVLICKNLKLFKIEKFNKYRFAAEREKARYNRLNPPTTETIINTEINKKCGSSKSGNKTTIQNCTENECCGDNAQCTNDPNNCGSGIYNNFDGSKAVRISKNGQCGGSQGKKTICPNNQCCSQWGWCGFTAEHCVQNPNSLFDGSQSC
jgi:hypothetical protein